VVFALTLEPGEVDHGIYLLFREHPIQQAGITHIPPIQHWALPAEGLDTFENTFFAVGEVI